MEQIFLTITIIFGLGILVSNLFIILGFRKLSKSQSLSGDVGDDRYYDLKYRIQFLIAIIFIAGSVVVFMGWNIKSQIISEIKNSMQNEITKTTRDSIQALTKDLSKLKTTVLKISVEHKVLTNDASNIQSNYKSLTTQQIKLSNEINQKLAGIRTLLNVYIIADREIDKNADTKPIRIYFKDLEPTNADRLPKFNSPPFINVFSNSSGGINIISITKEYIEYGVSHAIIADNSIVPNKTLFTLWIVDRDNPLLLKN